LIDSGSPIRRGEEKIMRDPLRVRVVGPLAEFAEGFHQDLQQRGYSPRTALRYMQLLGHLSRWLASRRGREVPLSSRSVDAWLRARRVGGYRTFLTVRAADPLLDYLHRQELLGPLTGGDVPSDGLLTGFARHLRVDRGLAERTVQRRMPVAQRILSAWEREGLTDLQALSAGDVTSLVLAEGRTAAGAVSGTLVVTLRSLLRFLHVSGVIERPLVQVVPSLASWKLTGLPKAVPAGQVSAVLASCAPGSVVRRRDLAVLTCLARLGLRAGEVAALHLEDVHWRCGEITVRGKGNRWERLPLPHDVGEVLASYLRNGHPGAAASRGRVFARVRAPYGPMTSGSVTQVVARAAVRAGFAPFYAHRLRHTVATEMLRAGGSLDDIGQVLRHHNRLTTTIYAKVDHEGLRTVARSWPGTAT
jgi:integrase/recombinase XerD